MNIELNDPQLKQLKEMYEQAVKDKKNEFIFMNMPVLTQYVKYLIEYAEQQFQKK